MEGMYYLTLTLRIVPHSDTGGLTYCGDEVWVESMGQDRVWQGVQEVLQSASDVMDIVLVRINHNSTSIWSHKHEHYSKLHIIASKYFQRGRAPLGPSPSHLG